MALRIGIMAGASSPASLPMTLQQFLDYTGWAGDAPRERMGIALEYFQNTVPLSYLGQPAKDPVAPDGTSLGPNPWLLPVPGHTDPRPSGHNPQLTPNKPRSKVPINLCTLMQTIDFSYPLHVRLIARGTRLKAFRTRCDRTERFGHFFTVLHASSESLAIPCDQTTAWIYEAVCSFSSLASTVADAYADWAMYRSVAPQYRHGGGCQLYVWDPQLRLRPVRGSPQILFQRVTHGFRLRL